MSFPSVDELQKALATNVFKDSSAAKKAAGRALGVLVELITFYMLRDWELDDDLAIERGLPEYGNSDITHNVEFSLHPAGTTHRVPVLDATKTITARQIFLACDKAKLDLSSAERRTTALLRKDVLRHSATFADEADGFWIANTTGTDPNMRITRLRTAPYAMFECKRVGIEEGLSLIHI